MKGIIIEFYMHYGMWLTAIPLMVSLAISQEDIGKIKANLETVINAISDLSTQIKALMIQQAEMSRTLGVLCSQQTETARIQADHEMRLRDHTKVLTPLVEKVEEHDKAIEVIKTVVFTPKGKVESEEEDGQGKVSLPRWLIYLGAASFAAGGATLLEFIKAFVTGKP